MSKVNVIWVLQTTNYSSNTIPLTLIWPESLMRRQFNSRMEILIHEFSACLKNSFNNHQRYASLSKIWLERTSITTHVYSSEWMPLNFWHWPESKGFVFVQCTVYLTQKPPIIPKCAFSRYICEAKIYLNQVGG